MTATASVLTDATGSRRRSRELALEAAIDKLDKYHLLILDDLAYVSYVYDPDDWGVLLRTPGISVLDSGGRFGSSLGFWLADMTTESTERSRRLLPCDRGPASSPC